MSSTGGNLENLRLRYRPSQIILLLVGESPPPRRGFFYDATATEVPLSRNTRKLFEDVFETKYVDRADFLNRFRNVGCYLFDLFKERGKTVFEANRLEKETAVAELCSLIQEAKPGTVVSVLKRTRKLVEGAVKEANVSVSYKALPYPTRNRINEYLSGLRPILSALKTAG